MNALKLGPRAVGSSYLGAIEVFKTILKRIIIHLKRSIPLMIQVFHLTLKYIHYIIV